MKTYDFGRDFLCTFTINQYSFTYLEFEQKNLFKKSCLHNPLFAFHNYLNIVVSYAKFSASSHDTVHKKSYAFYHVEHYEKHL